MIHYTTIIRELARNKQVFKGLFTGVQEKIFHWKPQPDKWNLLEIICHLHDEEREDFRARVKSVLTNPTTPLTPINPVAWVKERNYKEENYEEMVSNFLTEREQSIEWLSSLQSSKWDNTYEHPTLGPMSARLFLTNWLAHDYLHIRQIIKLKYTYFATFSEESLSYAGEW